MTSLRRSADRGPLGLEEDCIASPGEGILPTSLRRLGVAETAAVARSPRCLSEFQEAVEVANDPVIPVVASQFLRELLVLLLDREVQIFPAPFRQRLERPLESALRRLPFDHPCASLGSAPVMGEPQEVECPWVGGFPSLGVGVVDLGGLKPTRRVFSGWTVRPYLLIRLGKTSRIRRASSSRAAPITKSSA